MGKETDKKPRVLIIDDDELNITAFAKRLERRGFSTHVLGDGNEALALLEQEHFDIILLDIVMPQIDGFTLLTQIRKKYSKEQLPVIMVTIIDDSSDVFQAFESGANDYINKPINIDAAAARIKGQLSATDLQTTLQKLKAVEAVNALVITYHHEINNPLAIALGEMQTLEKEVQKFAKTSDKIRFKKIYSALDRIKSTLMAIKEASTKNELQFETYGATSKMVKIKKLGG